MSNYTLTTDLIADCMALSVIHKDLVNQSKRFRIETDNNGQNYIGLSKWFDGVYSDFDSIMQDLKYDNCKEAFQEFIEYCLTIIPEFQVENLEIKKLRAEIVEHELKEKTTKGVGEILHSTIIKINKEKIKEIKFKTIASATLHGQGEFPPNTLEELCESYKNVMSK